jgi:NADH-quinone oxidoreductase subunit M
MGVLAATGIILGAGYMLSLYQNIFFQDPDPDYEAAGKHPVTDINLREVITLIPLFILVFWIGFFPNTFLEYMHASVAHLISQVNYTEYAGQENLIAKFISEIF